MRLSESNRIPSEILCWKYTYSRAYTNNSEGCSFEEGRLFIFSLAARIQLTLTLSGYSCTLDRFFSFTRKPNDGDESKFDEVIVTIAEHLLQWERSAALEESSVPQL